MKKPDLWVPGWLSGVVLLVAGAVCLWRDKPDVAATYIVGSAIISVIRSIEKDRRER